MKGFRREQTSRSYFYFFIGLVSVVVLMNLAGGVSSRSVDSKGSAAEAKEKKLRALEKALFVDRVLSPPAALTTHTANATNPMTPMAGCSTVSNTVTCTGGPTAHVTVSNGNGTTVAATTYPSTINVNAGSGTVSSMSVTINNYTSSHSPTTNNSSRSVGLMLVSPSGRNLEIMRATGRGGTAQNNLTFTIIDSGVAFPDGSANATWDVQTGPFKPSAYLGTLASSNAEPTYTVNGGPALVNSAAPNGTSTLASVFTGETTQGNWKLYLVDDVANASGADIQFASWDIAITFTAASTPSTTTLTPNPTTAFTGANVTLTAQVTASATGTVTFQNNGVNVSCSEGAQPRPLNGSAQAVCTTTFSGEGIQPLSANYSGDGTFTASIGNANVYTRNHASSSGSAVITYCNTGTVTNDGHSDQAYSHTSPYPSAIVVGDGLNTDIPGSVSTLSVTLKGFTSAGTNQVRMLLVAPDGTHAYDFWSNAGAGAAGTGDYTIADGSTQLSSGSPLSPGTYGPAGYGILPDPFTPGPPSPAPQIPGSFSYASPMGNPNSKTFLTAFTGTAAHGTWSLFLHNAAGAGSNTSFATGWCLNITPATGHPTTVTMMSNPTNANLGASVTFTATVGSTPAVGSAGTVTFTENGGPLTGAPNGGVANVVNGVAIISTSGLPEGDHIVNGQYHDSTNTFSDSVGSVTMRVDKATSTPTLSGSTWSYCNTGAITIPAGTVVSNDFGPATPNPSNIFVTNLPGTINSVGVTLKNFHDIHADDLETLLVGPNGGSAPTTAQTLDFFTRTGGGFSYGPADINFSDAFTPAPSGSALAANNGPASYGAIPSYTTSPFFTLPGTLQRATSTGSFTFNTGNAGNPAVYKSTIANGTWSLYFDQLINDTGSGVNNGWCVNFVENPPVMAITGSHAGNFRQGNTADTYTVHVTNNGPGPTGDPDALHPVIITEIPPAGLTITGMSGTGWTCAVLPICKRSDAINSGASYPDITVTVSVGCNAGTPLSNTASVQGGGASGVVTSAGDSTTVSAVAADGSGAATVSPTTALAGATGQNFTFTYTAAAGGLNSGEVDVTIPAGWSGGSASTNNGSATITAGVIKVTGITTPSAAGSVVTIGYNGANVTTTAGASTFSTKEKSGCALTALASSPAVTVTNTDTWTGATSTDWNNAGNWNPGPAPSMINDVSIPNVATKPVISANDITINSLVVAANSSLTINGGRTLNINVAAPNSNASIDGQIVGSGTVQFGGGSHNLGGGGSFASTISSTLISGATVSLSSDMQMGSLTISGGATINLSGHTLSLSGTPTPLVVNGTFNDIPGTVLFNGASAQIASGITYGGLAINNSSGVTLSGDATVNNQLTLTSGDLDTTSFTLSMPPTATSSGSGDVVGNVKRTGFSSSGANTLSFGNPLNTIQINSDTVPGDIPTITVNLVKAVPSTSSPGHGFPNAVQRTYKITPAGITGSFSATLQLRYLSSELNNNAEASLLFWKFIGGGAWVKQNTVGMNTTVDTSNHDLKVTGVTGFSEWTMASEKPTATNVTTLTLHPLNGAVNGNRGQAVGWGFTIVDDTYWVVVAATDFCSSFDVNTGFVPCHSYAPVPHGTYTDFSQYNFVLSAPGIADTSQQNFSQTVPCSTPGNCTGTGSFTIDSNAPFGPLSGMVVVDYNLYDGDPTSGGQPVGGDFFITAPASVGVISPTAANGNVSGTITTSDGRPIEGAVVRLSGTQNRKSITDSNGNYRFDNVETNGFYSVTASRANYVFSPSQRSFSQLGNNTEATFTATKSGTASNPLDTPEYFVRQQYVDFLGREPDEGGFNFWSDQILACGLAGEFAYRFGRAPDLNYLEQTVPDCVQSRRINVSAAFFLSIEFQGTGGLVDRLYRSSYQRRPLYEEFMSDVRSMNGIIVGQSDWQHRLDLSKSAFIEAWIQLPAFRAAYDNLAADGYVDRLISNTGVNYTTAERDALVNGLSGGTLTRANVLQRITEDSRFIAAKFSEQFVLMEYFGYLRRNPDEPGYQFWLQKLNQFQGNFEQAEMVKAFLVSAEYRARFPR